MNIGQSVNTCNRAQNRSHHYHSPHNYIQIVLDHLKHITKGKGPIYNKLGIGLRMSHFPIFFIKRIIKENKAKKKRHHFPFYKNVQFHQFGQVCMHDVNVNQTIFKIFMACSFCANHICFEIA